MAEVFEAELAGELGFIRKVAIKRMLGEAASDDLSARRFLDEARIASRLHHANIVSVIDVGLLDGLPFQVLELVDGIDAYRLQSRSGGVLPLEVALIIANDVAHALDHAHGALDRAGLSLGIVHRDVKPANVLVSWGGDVKLTDFGIAVAHDRVSRTEAGLVAGTMGFIAPEQRTKSGIDGRTDVFSLGLTLHAMLTGYTPLRDIAVEMALIGGAPVTLDAMLPADIRELIAHAVAPHRRDRPTAAQFADAIGVALVPRLGRDPRSYLRAFLAPLHDTKPRPGALDQLLGLEVVLTAEPAGDAPPCYALRPTVVEKPLAGPSEVTTHASPVQAPASLPPTVVATPGTERVGGSRIAPATAAPRLTGKLAVAIALAGLVGGLGAWGLKSRSRGGEDHAVAAHLDGGARAMIADAGAVAADATAVVATAEPIDAAVDPRPVRPRTDTRRGSATHIAPPSDAAVAPIGVGVLQIVGEDNVGAKVLVDGQPIGHAPDKLDVSLGHHRIEIIRKDGTRLPAQDLDVTEYHTVAHPMRPTF